jgi:branched-chain amino acid transport system ATP-binding protein
MLLEAKGLSVSYDGATVLRDASIVVDAGEIVALLGPNGSGKSTLMNSLSRLVKLQSGTIWFRGAAIQSLPPYRSLELGLAHVLERHRLFPRMTVLENLLLGAGPRASPSSVAAGLDQAFTLFPRLAERKSQMAGSMSGGEQQMCAVARGLMCAPRLLMVDEPFIGLSPIMRLEVENAFRSINSAGLSILIIEQNVKEALRMSRRAYVLNAGTIAAAGLSSELEKGDRIGRIFMGQTS